MKSRDKPGSEQARRNAAQERVTFGLSPKFDHQFDGIPQAVVIEDPARRALNFTSVARSGITQHTRIVERLVCGRMRKGVLSFMSNEAKKVIDEHGDVDAFDFLELRDKVP